MVFGLTTAIDCAVSRLIDRWLVPLFITGRVFGSLFGGSVTGRLAKQKEFELTGTSSDGRIDLYKRSGFVIEAKQSREKGRPKELALAGQLDLFIADTQPRGQRNASRAWDQLMISARRQGEDYAKSLPPAHGWPPFVLVCDVGHCIEV